MLEAAKRSELASSIVHRFQVIAQQRQHDSIRTLLGPRRAGPQRPLACDRCRGSRFVLASGGVWRLCPECSLDERHFVKLY